MTVITGSGSTGRGAVLEGFRFVGIERDPSCPVRKYLLTGWVIAGIKVSTDRRY